jgi:hypothetical protein
MSHPLLSENSQRGSFGGPVCVSAPVRWARLCFGGKHQRWHAIDGLLAFCGRQNFDYPRVEYSDSRPTFGKLCKHCVAKLGAFV